MNTTHTETTRSNILTAVRTADGWYDRTRSLTAKWCTEALVDVASSVVVPEKFNRGLPTYRTATREEALERLCGWASSERIREWGEAFQAARAAALAELPAALEQLGAAL